MSSGPIEVIGLPQIPITMLREAAADILEGAPILRTQTWGIVRVHPDPTRPRATMTDRAVRFPHYHPPRGIYLTARLTLRWEYRGMPDSMDPISQGEAMRQLRGWAEARKLRLRVE